MEQIDRILMYADSQLCRHSLASAADSPPLLPPLPGLPYSDGSAVSIIGLEMHTRLTSHSYCMRSYPVHVGLRIDIQVKGGGTKSLANAKSSSVAQGQENRIFSDFSDVPHQAFPRASESRRRIG